MINKQKRKQKKIAKITASICAGASIITAGVVSVVYGRKKKIFEDSLLDVKTSNELL